jgi:flagellar biosynthetic protein FliR
MGLLLLSDIALAALARSMPQLNVLVLGFAIKIMLGLIGLALGIRLARAVLEPLFATTFQYWDALTSGR